MLVGSRLSTKKLIMDSILSIIKNIGDCDYHLVIGIAPYIDNKTVKSIRTLRIQNKNKIIVVRKNCRTFASFVNYVFGRYGKDAKWFLIAHDDIKLKTKNFIPTVEKTLSTIKENIGWISFTDDDYLNMHWAPSTRPGYHHDFLQEFAWRSHKMFQFHNFQDGWMKNGETFKNIDFPKAPVICHAPFSHFIMIESKKLKIIGPCEDWSEVSLLIDEDWGLSAMREGLRNIWIPDIIYQHCRIVQGTRAQPLIEKFQKECLRLFQEKWKISIKPGSAGQLSRIIREYKNTNIVWSIGKRSYEWEYVK